VFGHPQKPPETLTYRLHNEQRLSTMTFEKAFNKLKLQGAITLPFNTGSGNYIDVWASELLSGPRKGQSVIRIRWANSSSTLDSKNWSEPEPALIKHAKLSIEQKLGEYQYLNLNTLSKKT
jgi:hypothetical protein